MFFEVLHNNTKTKGLRKFYTGNNKHDSIEKAKIRLGEVWVINGTANNWLFQRLGFCVCLS